MSDPLQAIMLERALQDAKWGIQDHDDPAWLMILAEEVGEVASAVLPSVEPGDPYTPVVRGLVHLGAQAQALIQDACELGCPQYENSPAVTHERVQITAVGLAWLECMERRKPAEGQG